MLEACAELKKQGRQFRLLLAGQGIDMNAIRKKLEELQIEDRAQLLGHITDTSLLDGLYARASVFAFPSLYDAAPRVVREAAVMGPPSVMVGTASGWRRGKRSLFRGARCWKRRRNGMNAWWRWVRKES